MKHSILSILCAVVAAVSALSASAQPFPSKPVRVVAPFPPGGGADFILRVTQERFSAALGQPVIVENKPGAGGTIGADSVAKAAPDGYTLLLGNIGTHAIAPAIYQKLPYDAVRDFVPVAHATNTQYGVVVGPKLAGVNTLAELIAAARARPGGLTFGSGGAGQGPHLGGELLKLHARIPLVHVPYKGGGPMVIDLLGGQIDLLVSDLPTVIGQLKKGSLRLIAVPASTRSALFPDVPTAAEAGLPGFEMYAWLAMFAPAGTPAEVVRRLSEAFTAALKAPEVAEKIVASGSVVVAGGPQALADFQQRELQKWQRLVQDAGIERQ